ncbi:hypothetical protein FA13DRAFT_1708414 [Coprinellus micaceus]|uniref:Uncharacterized protein n=1 Tax=Coprinellus micaceus TaxID=71717 RepID=A0A4Y7TG45_COPMI|nr:hypothetical protein FA13DRAFT_1708414 [Coprinellus micaceus]
MVHWLSGTDIIYSLDLRFENGWINTEIAPHGLKGPGCELLHHTQHLYQMTSYSMCCYLAAGGMLWVVGRGTPEHHIGACFNEGWVFSARFNEGSWGVVSNGELLEEEVGELGPSGSLSNANGELLEEEGIVSGEEQGLVDPPELGIDQAVS